MSKKSMYSYILVTRGRCFGVHNHVHVVIHEGTLMTCVYYTAQSVTTVKGILDCLLYDLAFEM